MDDFSLDQPRYTRPVVVQLASISIEFLERCEEEDLVQVRAIRGGSPGYSARDIRNLTLLRRLYEDLELDFAALEVVLHMRSQVLELREQLERLERAKVEREEQLVGELTELRRRLAVEQRWR